MSLVMTSGPTSEPITLAEVKAHLRLDGTAEDVYLGSLILTSRLQIEAALGLALIAQSWRLTLDDWPAQNTLELPMRPIASVTSISASDPDGDTLPLDIDAVRLDRAPVPRLIAGSNGWPRPTSPYNTIEVDFTAGYGANAAAVPAPIRQALLLLVAHWYEHRDPYAIATAIPCSVSDLLMPYRIVTL
jgi:uncharacterized phiE125 gp8 family phage protein